MTPGAERAARDIKLGTFCEVATIVVVLPLAAFFFGRYLPRVLGRRFPQGSLSFEWAAAGMALSVVLWRGQVRPIVALPIAVAVAALTAAFIVRFRTSVSFRRLFTADNRRHLVTIGAAGAAWELARLSSPRNARPLLHGRLIDLLVVGVLAVILSLFLARLRRRPSGELRRAASVSWIVVTLASIGIVVPGVLPGALFVSAASLVVAPWVQPPALPRANLVALLLLVLSCGWTIYFQPYGPVNLFEDGHALAYADAYRSGATPFRDTFPVHGWGEDGGVDAMAFRVFGSTIGTFRARRAIFTTLTLVALALVCVLVMGSLGWGAAALLLSLAISPFVSERTLFAWVAIALLAAGLRHSRRVWLVLAGAVAAVEIFFALDMGLIVLLGGLAGLTLVGLTRRELRDPIAFLLGAGGGAIPFLVDLVAQNALRSFVHVSFSELPKQILDSWGLPAAPLFARPPELSKVLTAIRGDPVTPTFLVVVLAICVTAALFANPWRGEDAIIVPALVIAIIALRGVFGRADVGHAELYGAYAGLPATWLLRRTLAKSQIVSAALVAFFWMGLRPVAGLRAEVSAITSAAASRAAAAQTMSVVPRGGSARLPADQASDLGALRDAIDRTVPPSETFFDFSNEPALYFLLGRRIPIPYLGPEFYETEDLQQRVIALCERHKPPIVIARAGNGLYAIDGIANDVRAPAVATYLKGHYRPLTIVAGRAILRRVPSGSGDARHLP